MTDPDHARMMLGKAQGDLLALKGMGDAAVFKDHIFGFHAQQAVEKALKAWISLRGQEYARTHDIHSLLETLRGTGAGVDDLEDFIDLTPWAVEFRYEPVDEADQPLDRPSLIDEVDRLIADVDTMIQAAEQGQGGMV